MAKHIVKLNKDIDFDLGKLIETRLLIQANSGGGKSYAIRRIIEQAFGKVQIIVLDPEGEFTNLRGKFDFIYAGKGGDAPVESRSATLLAHRLLELKASAIIDLYELPPQERKHFVRLFCEAMVNSPKELWHEVLVIIDEAHVFAPEKGESEAMGPVIDLATRGRKRGYCVVLATQRLPKLNKDAAAECNNKLIGRASQDIDRKRAAEELGFTTKEQILSLRDLSPGEFYVFGPAISREVQKIHIGLVNVTPPPRGVGRSTKIAPPTAKVKAMLAKLSDIPQEVEKEIRTTRELGAELTAAKREIQALKKSAQEPVLPPIQMVEKAIQHALSKKQDEDLVWEKRMIAENNRLRKILADLVGGVTRALDIKAPSLEEKQTKKAVSDYIDTRIFKRSSVVHTVTKPVINTDLGTESYGQRMIATGTVESTLGKGELVVLKAIASVEDGMTREHITVQTSYKRSTRDAYIQRMIAKGLLGIDANTSKIVTTPLGIEALGPDYQPLPTGQELIDHHLRTLPQGESAILKLLIDRGESLSREEISTETGYQRSTRDAYIQRLMSRQLVESGGPGEIKASSFLFV